MSLQKVEDDLIGEVKLSPLQAKVFLLVTTGGKMTTEKISAELRIPKGDAEAAAKSLVELGGFIDLSPQEYEAMHPRFTAVNMYRKMCKRENLEFKKNLVVDNIGVVLERHYEHVRTK